ncbi:MAG: hypothetical protein ACR2JY_08540 [Chloroflexota bacterium]
MRYKIEAVSGPDEQENISSDGFVAIATCPQCGARWKSNGALPADDPNAGEKQGSRRVEMLAQMRNGCPDCSQGGRGVQSRQHGRLRSAWPGSRR